jgi:hypothetical protein
MKELVVLGLSGRAGCGKDYIHQNFLRPLGFHQWSFAWHFKVWVVAQRRATYEEVFHTKPPHVRHMLQQEGTELGRNVYGEDIWVDAMFGWFQLLNETWGINKFCVPDVRFPNEVYGIQRNGGKVIRIIAPERESHSGLSEEARQHISETALDEFPLTDFDGFIKNNPGRDVQSQLKNMEHLLGIEPVITSDIQAQIESLRSSK